MIISFGIVGPSQMRSSRSAWLWLQFHQPAETCSTLSSSVVYSASQWSGWMSPSFDGGRRSPMIGAARGSAVAEPLRQHLLARNLIVPDFRRHIVDEARADMETARSGVVVDRIRHGVGDDGIVPPSGMRPRGLRQAGRARRAILRWVREPLAEGVQPDHLAAEPDGLGEQLSSAVSGMRRPGCTRSAAKRAV